MHQLSYPEDTNRQEAESMYALLLRDLLIEIESNKEEMVTFCRQKCANDTIQLRYIQDFENTYAPSQTINWYTRDTFLYRLLNKALRDQDIGTLYSLRYFIKDLHLQLHNEYISQQQSETITTVYRGQLMSDEEFDKRIRCNVGGLFSVYSFLSTTFNKRLAILYAGNHNRNDTSSEQSVLFHIDLNKPITKFPYANISTLSAFEAEDEILFTMGAVFRIVSIKKRDKDCCWNVYLQLTNEEDKELRTLTGYIRKEIKQQNPLFTLINLVRHMANYEQAEKFCQLLLKDPSFISEFSSVCNIKNVLGCIYSDMGQHAKATEWLEKLINDISVHSSPVYYIIVAHAYNHLAVAYLHQNERDKALECFRTALDIVSNSTNPDKMGIATLYSNIGAVYIEQKRISEALEMFEKSLEIHSRLVPSNHPSLASLHNSIAAAYSSQDDYDDALEHYDKARQIQCSSLQSHHPDIAAAYYNIATVLLKKDDLLKALEMYNKSLEMRLKILPPDHLDIAASYTAVSLIEQIRGNYNEALKGFNQAHQIRVNDFKNYHVDIDVIYKNLAEAFRVEGGSFAILKQPSKLMEEALIQVKKAQDMLTAYQKVNFPKIMPDLMGIDLIKKQIEATKK
ncbi:unnamed protein product [Adineta steineri]|uniref:NAD(P)(+)--arginine ADP-ribosyltransferase n=1 Tax=Adineta steineri TaxID=433720 RepID=A0A814M638_9BILA|nr:unnamed protein product [Adineta steineri]CAF1074485.1 unnamed protein product [Adineta steineri]CAF1075209.1 unnamed protein product [Adineta steineri]